MQWPVVPLVPIAAQGEKIVVSDYSLADWIVQTYGLKLDNWPLKKPEHISKEAYEQLKKAFKGYIQHNKPTSE